MNLLAALLVLAAPALQDKVTFKFNPQKGDKLAMNGVSTIKLPMTMPDGSSGELEQKITNKRVTHYLEVADGKLTKVLYDCQEEMQETKQPGMDSSMGQEMPLHGRKITVEKRDGKLVREGADDVEEKALKELTLEDKPSRLFPKNAVAVGDSWDVAPEDVKAFLEGDPFQKGTIKCKLTELKTVDGRKCAVINAKLDLAGTDENGMELGLVMEGDAIIWLDRGYMLSLKAKGKMTLKSPMFNGEGPATFEVTQKVE
jgi:major membrane immunogen (membrane-anchored lipoprotein)